MDNITAIKSITLIVDSPKKGKNILGLNLDICINEGILLKIKLEKQILFTIAMNFRKSQSKKELKD